MSEPTPQQIEVLEWLRRHPDGMSHESDAPPGHWIVTMREMSLAYADVLERALVLFPEEGKTIEVEEEWVCRDGRADFKCRGEESRAMYAARPSFSSGGGVWHYGTHESCGLSLRVSGVVRGARKDT